MSFYDKYIFPRYLNWAMGNKSLGQYRADVASEISGVGLEVGFGSGLNLQYYTNITRLYALDLSEELYDLAKGKVATTTFPIEHIKASAEQIPLPDASLDFVVSTWSLCSIPHPEIALREIFRVLKPSGVFSFVEHGKSPKDSIFKLQNFLTPLSKRFAGGCHMNRDIEELVLDAGFEMRKLEKFSLESKPLAHMYKGVALAKK